MEYIPIGLDIKKKKKKQPKNNNNNKINEDNEKNISLIIK